MPILFRLPFIPFWLLNNQVYYSYQMHMIQFLLQYSPPFSTSPYLPEKIRVITSEKSSLDHPTLPFYFQSTLNLPQLKHLYSAMTHLPSVSRLNCEVPEANAITQM